MDIDAYSYSGGDLMRVSLPCCEVFEDFDREIHCQHVHFFGGATKYNHKAHCDHSACVRMREEKE